MRRPVLLAAALALAACNSGDDAQVRDADGDGTISSDEVEAQLGDAIATGSYMQAGQWESRITIEEARMPGMSEDMTAMMQEMTGDRTYATCLTEEQVRQPDERFFTGEENDCSYERFTLKDGRIDAAMTCRAQGMTQDMELTGEYGATSYDMTVRATSPDEGGMEMVMNISAERVGDCNERTPA